MATVEKIITAYSSHQINLERLNATLGNQFAPFIERVTERVTALINKLPARNPFARLQSTLDAVDVIVKEELREAIKQLKASQREIGKNEIAFNEKVLGSVIKSEVDFTSPSIAQIATAVNAAPIKMGDGSYTTYQRMFRKYTEDRANMMDGIIRNGFASGTTNREIAERILADLPTWNKNAESTARTLARTGTNHYATQARLELGKENEDIITGWRYVATIDSRTCPICRPADGTVMKESDPKFGSFKPPRHPNTRSCLAPVIDGRYTYDTSESKRPTNFTVDGKKDFKRVDSKKTYYEEFSKLSAKDQDAILGSTLGKAFRKLDDPDAFAKMTIDSKTLRPLTIEQLKRKQNRLAEILKSV